MKLEEILPLIREGKKFTIKNYDSDGEHWIAGKIGFIGMKPEDMTLTLHRINKSDCAISEPNSWGIPRWAILDDSWEICEDLK